MKEEVKLPKKYFFIDESGPECSGPFMLKGKNC